MVQIIIIEQTNFQRCVNAYNQKLLTTLDIADESKLQTYLFVMATNVILYPTRIEMQIFIIICIWNK